MAIGEEGKDDPLLKIEVSEVSAKDGNLFKDSARISRLLTEVGMTDTQENRATILDFGEILEVRNPDILRTILTKGSDSALSDQTYEQLLGQIKDPQRREEVKKKLDEITGKLRPELLEVREKEGIRPPEQPQKAEEIGVEKVRRVGEKVVDTYLRIFEGLHDFSLQESQEKGRLFDSRRTKLVEKNTRVVRKAALKFACITMTDLLVHGKEDLFGDRASRFPGFREEIADYLRRVRGVAEIVGPIVDEKWEEWMERRDERFYGKTTEAKPTRVLQEEEEEKLEKITAASGAEK